MTKRKQIFWLKRLYILWRDHYQCQYCGATEAQLHIDHIFPKSRGGKDSISNLITSCRSCNLSKSDKTLLEWKQTSSINVIVKDQDNETKKEIGINGVPIKKIRQFAIGLLEDQNLAMRRWSGRGNLFSQNEYIKFISRMVKIGLVKKRFDDASKQGYELTDLGYKTMMEIANLEFDIEYEPECNIEDTLLISSEDIITLCYQDIEAENSTNKVLAKEPIKADPDQSDPDTDKEDDILVDLAIELIYRENYASTSFLQRKLKIGYNRAGRVMDRLVEMGIVGSEIVSGRGREIIKNNSNPPPNGGR